MKAHFCTKQMSLQLIPPKHTMDWREQHLRRGMGAIEVTYKIEKTMEQH